MSAVTQTATGAEPKARKARTSKPQPLQAALDDEALLRMSTIEALTGLSRSTIYAKIKKKEFPQLVRERPAVPSC